MPVTEKEILEKLNTIPQPDGRNSLVGGGAVRQLDVDGSSVRLQLAVTVTMPKMAEPLRGEVEHIVRLGLALHQSLDFSKLSSDFVNNGKGTIANTPHCQGAEDEG